MFEITCERCKHKSKVTDKWMKNTLEEDEIVCPKCSSLDVCISQYPEGLSNSSTIEGIEEYLGIK
jgi:DNA-directed RNA polymerase subunit RPC12/RpoP